MAAESPTSTASTSERATRRADQESYAVTMEIFRPSALKRAKSRTLFIGPHECRMESVERIPFEQLQVLRDQRKIGQTGSGRAGRPRSRREPRSTREGPGTKI